MPNATLHFFRSLPSDPASQAALLSSMQSVETSFFLIALSRFPHALTACVSAIEYAIRESLSKVGRKPTLQHILEQLRNRSAKAARIPAINLNRLRVFRNQLTHQGFRENDDSESTSLYIDVAFPLLEATYQDLYSFDLRDSLLQDFLELLEIAEAVHKRAKLLPDCDVSYCLNPFGHLVRLSFKESFSADWELDVLSTAEQTGEKWEKSHKMKQHLEYKFNAPWIFNCPVCKEVESVVCELDINELELRNVIPNKMICTACQFVARESHHFISKALLKNQADDACIQIFEEYGI
jgi:transcription elongation factor Elf1